LNDLRQQVEFETTPVTLTLDLLAAVLAFLPGAWTWRFWSRLPERVPIHFGPGGHADAWGSRNMIWLLPAVSVFLLVLLLTLLRHPTLYNMPIKLTEENVHRQMHLARWVASATMLWALVLLAWISWEQIQVAMGEAPGLGGGLYVLLGAEAGILIWYFSAVLRRR
jgi:uncharacterized membrane protein